MYEYVDRPVSRLSPGSRLVLWAARGWVHARANGTCPPGAIAPALIHCGAGAALPHLHRLMQALEGDDGGLILMPALDHPLIEDLEAVLLRLWADAIARPARAKATLALMLTEPGAESDGRDAAAFEALTSAAAQLVARGLPPVGFAAAGSPA